jgi:hypothetical protein
MHHYRCQNVYISTTASKRIVDTLEFSPHNYQMPHLSSTDWLLMATKDMMDAFQNPHLDVPFASVGDDTVKALADLEAIFKLKLQQAPPLTTSASPTTLFQRPIIIPLSTHILISHMPYMRQTISHTTIHTQDIPDRPLPPRVVTTRTLRHSPPRVPTGSQRLSPRNLSQDDFCEMDTAHMTIALGNNHWSQRHHVCSHPPSHQKRNGILGSHEGSLSPTTLDPRFWQRMRTPVPGHSRHPRNRYMFLHHVEKHPIRQKYHLRQNSLQLQTTQARKGTRSANRRRRQTPLLWRCRHFNIRYHNIQNHNQQHPLHQRRRHDDDGHQELLYWHPAATV